MGYYINPASLSAVFTVPCVVADNHLKLASDVQLRVLLYVLRHLTEGIDAGVIASQLGIEKADCEDSLLYWVNAGVLSSDTASLPLDDSKKKPVVRKAVKPTRDDVALRGMEDERIRFLLHEAQIKFGRNLKTTESSTLVWLYDDEGMDVSVILMLVQYAVNEGRCNMSFIEKTAVDWLNSGVQTVMDAEEKIADIVRKKSAWAIVERAFGIEKRMPSTKELELSAMWIEEWGFSEEILHCAYEVCVDTKSKFLFSYTAKVLEKWHKNGYKSIEEIEEAQAERKNAKQSSGAAYDLDAFERMLNSDDGE